jgi:hypothetical protein
VVSAAEIRYARCVEKDKSWITLSQGLDKEKEEATKKGYPSGAPWLLFMRALDGAHFESSNMGVKAYCASQPWQLIHDPSSLSATQLETYKRENPDRNVSYDIALISSMLALGKDSRWTEAPCDKLFWPPGFPPRKQ